MKMMLEILLHNIKTLVLGLKDGMFKGIQEGKIAIQNEIQGGLKQIKAEPEAIQIQIEGVPEQKPIEEVPQQASIN